MCIRDRVCLQPGLQTEAIKIGKSAWTVSRRLSQLEKYRILENRLGWMPATTSRDDMAGRLYQAALDLDTIGAAERQRVYHKKQRILFKQTLERQKKERDEAGSIFDEHGELISSPGLDRLCIKKRNASRNLLSKEKHSKHTGAGYGGTS